MGDKEEKKEKEEKSEKPIIFLIGPPGSGKGTLAEKVKKEHKFAHLCFYEILKEKIKEGGEESKKIEKKIKAGELIPKKLAVSLLKSNFEKEKDSDGHLIDGFPYMNDQGVAFEKECGKVTHVVYLECSDEKAEKRLKEKYDEKEDLEHLKKRDKLFKKHIKSVVKHYQTKLTKISTEGDSEKSYEKFKKILDKIVKKKE